MGKTKIKRFLIVSSIIGIIVLSLFTINAVELSFTRKAIEKEIQNIKASGEPAAIEELIPVEIPDNENGALVYNEVFSLKKELGERYTEEWKYMPYESEKKWEEISEGEKEKIRNLLFKNPEFIKFYQLLEKASNMKCQFLKRKDYEKGAETPLPHLTVMRSCARMITAKAKLQAERGEIDNALNTCLTGLKVSNSLSDEPILISQLVRMAIDAIMLNQIEEVLNKGEAKIETYQSLIDETKKAREEKLTYAGSIGERLILGIIEFPLLYKDLKRWGDVGDVPDMLQLKKQPRIDSIITFVSSRINPKGFIAENELTYFREMAKLIPSVKLPYWEAKDKLANLEKELMKLPKRRALLTQLLMPGLCHAYCPEARLDAQLGNTAIAFACLIYKTKFGNYPSSLNQLAPQNLESLPLDPFTGKDFIYKKKGEGFIVYSLGDNGKDDGGNWGKPNKWAGDFDIVFELTDNITKSPR